MARDFSRVRRLVNEAIHDGVLVRQSCRQCGASEALAHHEDYGRPLDVIWLCRKCHAQRHAEIRRQTTPDTRKALTYVRLEPAVKQALSRVAQIDGRSLSALISKIATDWVKEFAGKMPAKEQRRG